nr:1-acyl-sn-glycerol-3-phosphate acyltransferase [Anaerolineae bacterium]
MKEPRYPVIRPWLQKPMIAIIRLLVNLLTRVHVEGQEYVPAEGPMILVANHLHHLDSPIVAITAPRTTQALAGEKYIRHPFFAPILKIAGSIFINRGEVDRKALTQAFNLLEDGKALAIAIEGTRSKTGGLSEGKVGTAYIATRSGAPLVPVVVWGTENIIPAWKKLRRADVYAVYGKPFYLPHGRFRTAELEKHTETIMLTLAEMLPQQYRGIYSKTSDQNPRQQPEMSTGR